MQVVRGGPSLWIYTILCSSLQQWGRVSASTSSPTLPAPELDIYSRSDDSVGLVCRAPRGHRGVLFMLYQFRDEVDTQELQSGAEVAQFTVRVKEVDSVQLKLFCCLYKNQEGRYSAFSPYLQLERHTDALPVPTLVLRQHTEVWHLQCTGSPAYPGAVFSLYLIDNELPVATHHSIHHKATFPVPVQDAPVASYQCRYSVLLGRKWSNSERSLPLAVARGSPPQSSPDEFAVDWPLILGSFSAVVMFLCSVVFVAVVAQRKVKASAEEKKKRQDAKFWTQVHAKDHAVDLPLRNTSITSSEWATVDAATETPSRSPLCNSLSTFTAPIHPIN